VLPPWRSATCNPRLPQACPSFNTLPSSSFSPCLPCPLLAPGDREGVQEAAPGCTGHPAGATGGELKGKGEGPGGGWALLQEVLAQLIHFHKGLAFGLSIASTTARGGGRTRRITWAKELALCTCLVTASSPCHAPLALLCATLYFCPYLPVCLPVCLPVVTPSLPSEQHLYLPLRACVPACECCR
jgi:hypothetical protein